MTGQQPRSLATTERTRLTMSDFQREIIRLSEQQSEASNLLVYGDSGAGKTVLAGTLPPKTFWLVCEPGFKSAVRHRQREGLKPHVGARRVTNTAEAWAAIEWLEHRDRYRQLDWVVVDGASTMQDKFRLAYAAEAFDRDPTKRAHRNLPDRPDYFNTQNFMKSWLPRLIDMPVNLLVTAHAYRTDKTDDGELLVFPGFQGKVTEVANAISGLMDATGYMESRRIKNKRTGESRTERRLWFESPTDRRRDEYQEVRYIVGDKFSAFGEYIANPTMEQIQALINGQGEETHA